MKQLQTAANFTQVVKRDLRSSLLKQTPLTRKVKEGIKIPKSYWDAGNFVTPQWHTAEKKEMKGVLDSESWQEIEQSLVTPDMNPCASHLRHQTTNGCKEPRCRQRKTTT